MSKRKRKDWDEWEEGRYKEAQKLIHVLRKAGYKPTKRILAIARDPTNDEFWEDFGDEIEISLGVESWWVNNRWVLRKWKPGMERHSGKLIKYTREDPKYIRSSFAEMKQHNVPFRTRMQWLSRNYGGRGGYTSEELYKIVTGKTASAYYIFPFVKGAPPEVNRILERTYRRHRAAGGTKVSSAIAAWAKVKQAGYVKVTKPGPAWVKKKEYNMKPMNTVNQYGIGTAIGKLTDRGVRGMWRTAKKYPRVVGTAGAFGAGVLTAKELAKRRKRQVKPMYALPDDYPGPAGRVWDLPSTKTTRLKSGLRRAGQVAKPVGKRIGQAAATGAKAMLVALAAKEVLDWMSKRRPYMPEIRPDIELSGYQKLEEVTQYAGLMDSPTLQTLKSKSGAALSKTKKGVERGLLLWLMGFISAELLARGITSPKKRHEVTLPQQGYARNVPKGFQPYNPRISATADMTPIPPAIVKRAKHLRHARTRTKWIKHGKRSAMIALPLAAGMAAKHIVTRRQKKTWKEKLRKKLGYTQDDYSFKSAAGKTLRTVKRVGGVVGKTLGTATNIAIPALIGAEVIGAIRRKRQPEVPPMPKRSLTVSSYTISQKRKLAKILARKLKVKQGIDIAAAKVQVTRTRMKQATKLGKYNLPELPPGWNKYLFATKGGRDWLQSYIDWEAEMYPLKSEAQRRWMHMKHPEMAEEWEKKTKGKLPEKVAKHSVVAAAKHLKSLRHLGKSGRLGKSTITWTKQLAEKLRKTAMATKDPITKKRLLNRANAWDTASEQVGDVLAKAGLEKVGIAAVGAAAGVAAHETGKQRERIRVRKAVG